MNFRFITAVWGDWHRTALLSANLPSLLAPRNLPALAGSHDLSFEIYTSESDAPLIAADESYRRIAALLPCKLVALKDAAFRGGAGAYVANQPIWKLALDSGEKVPAGLMAPDMVWADGAMEALVGCFEAGKRAVYMTVLRAIEETFMPAIQDPSRGLLKNDGTLVISPQQLSQLTVDHFHPLHITSMPTCPYRIFHFEHLMYPVSSHALLARTLAAHCLAIDPSFYEVNDMFSPSSLRSQERIEFAPGVDRVFGVSLTPLTKDVDWYHDNMLSYDSLFIGNWFNTFFNPVHKRLSQVAFKFASENVPASGWDQAERDSDAFVKKIRANFEFVRVMHAFQHNEMSRGGLRLLAVAAIVGDVAERWTREGPFTMLLPSHRALQEMPAWYIEALMTSNPREQLWDFLKAHTIPIPIDLEAPRGAGDGAGNANSRFTVWNLAGDEIVIERKVEGAKINGMEVIMSRALADGSYVHIVDGLLEKAAV